MEMFQHQLVSITDFNFMLDTISGLFFTGNIGGL
jgi:hypothetical protein